MRQTYRVAECGLATVRSASGCLWSLGALPELLVWDHQAGPHAGGGHPTEQ